MAACLTAQQPMQTSYFPKPSYFRETFSAPNTRIELRPPVRLADYVVGGKLELSLRAYLELVMANNTDVAISRLAVEIQKNAITRSYSPFDPNLVANFNNQRTKTPANDALAGATTVSQLSQPVNFSFAQTLENGTQYNVGFAEIKSTTNSSFATFNPVYNSNLSVSFIQPLIRNRGSYVNHIPLMVARSRVRKSEYELRNTLLLLLQTSELAYWRAIELRENLRVQESALSLADQTLKRSQRELELGAISRLDIYQPEFQFAQAEGNVSQSRFSVFQQDDTLRRQIGADLDPEIRKLPIVLTESPTPPPSDLVIDPEAQVEKALFLRPDLKSAVQDLDVDDLSIKSIRNQLRPDLSLTAGYTAQGRGGTGFIRQNVFNDVGSRSTITQVLPGGFGDSIDQLFGFGFPIYSFGLRLRLPIRNRQSAADLADALINKKRDALQARGAEQQVRLDVVQAVSQVESSKASVSLAIKARDFAQKRLDAEQKKYELGTSQIFLVLQAQTDLIGAESNVVRESVNFRRNELNLLRTTGELLSERGVTIQ